MAPSITRRQVLRTLTAAASGTAALGLYAWRIEPHWLEFTYPELPIAGLPNELDGSTLVQLSDLHVGLRVDDDYIIQSLQRVQEIAPDFVVHTGDWISYSRPGDLEKLRRDLEHMPRGRLGTVGILGNHDYGRNWRMVDVADKVAAIARAAGVVILRNEAFAMPGLQFIGLDDYWSPRFDPIDVLAQKGKDLSTIVLCHNPDVADLPVWGEFQGWILAGHTHGGQCKPPFLPPPLLPVRNKRYTAGKFEISGNRRMYISRGVGHLIRVRFNVRPEIPVFRLRRAG